jgi:tRNA pseudouridine55 synthase
LLFFNASDPLAIAWRAMARTGEGVWLVNKPVGPTSFETLDATRDRFAPLKACHGGALDPFASGLLAVLAGSAVHVFHLLHELPKTYVATVRWGSETDNGDLHGKVIAEGDASGLTQAMLDEALQPHLGWQLQVPPKFSNKRVNKERAWRRAQAGEEFELPAEREYLHEAKWRDLGTLELTCRGGYYVRALARDLGRALGCRAHLSALHRSVIGPWHCPTSDAEYLPLLEALSWLPKRVLTDDEMGRLRRKEALGPGALQPASWSVPAGFPLPEPRALGVHLGRAAALLDAKHAPFAML